MDPLHVVTLVRTDADGIRFTFFSSSRLSGGSGFWTLIHSVYRWGEGENVSELLGARSRNEKKSGNKRKETRERELEKK